MSPSPVPPPDLGIPSSSNTVSVSIIDSTTSVAGVASARFVKPDIPGFEYLVAGSYSFLIQHPTLHRNLVFDLAFRKDKENLCPPLLEAINNVYKAEVWAEKDVKDVLEEGGFDTSKVEAVIWSHWHFDHVGNPATFEPHTALIVGPGFKEKVAPGWPANPESSFLEADYAGRELREISFEGPDVVTFGQFRAFDYFGDGSFYLLDTPGHAIGHLCGFARVTTAPDSFIFMGGDACHHGGEFRPSQYLPLPQEIIPNPFTSLTSPLTPCPGALFEKLLPDGDPTKSIFGLSTDGVHFDVEEAQRTIEKVKRADCREDILIVMAHDESLRGVVDFYPKTMNDFMQRGIVKKARWLFLRDFAVAVGHTGIVEGQRGNWAKWNGGNTSTK